MSGDDPIEGDRLLQRAYNLGAPDTTSIFTAISPNPTTPPTRPAWGISTRLAL